MCKLHLLVTGPFPVPWKVLNATGSETLNPAERAAADTLKSASTPCRTTEIITSCLHTASWLKAGYKVNRLHTLPC